MYTGVCARLFILMHVSLHMCVYIYESVCLYLHVCEYIQKNYMSFQISAWK